MKEEEHSSSPRCVKVEQFFTPPRHVKEEQLSSPPCQAHDYLLHAIVAKARGRIRHYLDGGSSGGNNSFSRSAITAEEYADRERRRRDRPNTLRRSVFADSDVLSPHITTYLELAMAWALDRSKMAVETNKCYLCRLDEEISKYD